MTFAERTWKTVLTGVLGVSTVLAVASCSSPEEPTPTPENSPTITHEASETPAETAEPVDIPADTAVGEESQRIVDILNAEADTTVEDWEDSLHSSFTAEVSAEDLVDLFNQNLRPAQPFTVTGYEGGNRQAVSTLTSPVSAPLDMTVVLDADGLITGLHFGESAPAG